MSPMRERERDLFSSHFLFGKFSLSLSFNFFFSVLHVQYVPMSGRTGKKGLSLSLSHLLQTLNIQFAFFSYPSLSFSLSHDLEAFFTVHKCFHSLSLPLSVWGAKPIRINSLFFFSLSLILSPAQAPSAKVTWSLT